MFKYEDRAPEHVKEIKSKFRRVHKDTLKNEFEDLLVTKAQQSRAIRELQALGIPFDRTKK